MFFVPYFHGNIYTYVKYYTSIYDLYFYVYIYIYIRFSSGFTIVTNFESLLLTVKHQSLWFKTASKLVLNWTSWNFSVQPLIKHKNRSLVTQDSQSYGINKLSEHFWSCQRKIPQLYFTVASFYWISSASR